MTCQKYEEIHTNPYLGHKYPRICIKFDKIQYLQPANYMFQPVAAILASCQMDYLL